MPKLSVAQAADKFKVSKEAIHNRIRRGSLNCVIEHGVKYVLIDESEEVKTQTPQDNKYYHYIEEENTHLKNKIAELEIKNSKLRDQKELLIIEEKTKIEQIYKEKDIQLKQLLHTISTRFLPQIQKETTLDELIEDVVDVEELVSEPMRLKDFLKLKAYKPAKRQRIKNKFKRLLGQEERVFKHQGKVCIDPSKYDYKDLLF